ncbi:MAG: NosD domain-containing protein [Myxococcaceae bacterium]
MTLRWLCACWLFLLIACGEAPLSTDASDAGGVDAGEHGHSSPDSGCADCDAGAEPDAGFPPDGGPDDAGAVESGPLRIHLAPDGDDARNGLSHEASVLTLERVNALLHALQPRRDVEIRIAPGTYFAQRVNWTYTMPEYAIVFMPADGGTSRPVFDGCTADGTCSGGTWFRFVNSGGRPTNLVFRYLRVQRYSTAISLEGDRNRVDGRNGNNTIFGCYFDRIGNVFNTALSPSTAAVRLVNSDDNRIENNHFVDIINSSSPALLHAIYAAHGSERNVVSRNRFVRNAGDPVRLRDFSNDNRILENTFVQSGIEAGYTDWYCDQDARTDCTKPTPECPSWDNQFRDNVLNGTYACAPLGTFHYFQDETTSGCQKPTSTSVRLRTSGNVQQTPPCSP